MPVIVTTFTLQHLFTKTIKLMLHGFLLRWRKFQGCHLLSIKRRRLLSLSLLSRLTRTFLANFFLKNKKNKKVATKQLHVCYDFASYNIGCYILINTEYFNYSSVLLIDFPIFFFLLSQFYQYYISMY